MGRLTRQSEKGSQRRSRKVAWKEGGVLISIERIQPLVTNSIKEEPVEEYQGYNWTIYYKLERITTVLYLQERIFINTNSKVLAMAGNPNDQNAVYKYIIRPKYPDIREHLIRILNLDVLSNRSRE